MSANVRRALKIMTLTTPVVGAIALAYLFTWNGPATMAKLQRPRPGLPVDPCGESLF